MTDQHVLKEDSAPVKRYDTMGFVSEYGVYVRAVDYDALASRLSNGNQEQRDADYKDGYNAGWQAAMEQEHPPEEQSHED